MARKRTVCRYCGEKLSEDQYVEFRIMEWTRKKVKHEGGAHKKWQSCSLLTTYLCPVCAMEAVDRVDEGRRK